MAITIGSIQNEVEKIGVEPPVTAHMVRSDPQDERSQPQVCEKVSRISVTLMQCHIQYLLTGRLAIACSSMCVLGPLVYRQNEGSASILTASPISKLARIGLERTPSHIDSTWAG
jgi:hypothetical protein